MTVLIDSWSWIEYWRGSSYSKKIAEVIDESETSIVSTINVAETFLWVLRHYDIQQARERMVTIAKRCFLVPVDEKIATEAAMLKHKLKKSLADSIVLATARAGDAKVLTGDKDFKGLPDTIYLGD
jgi:predicted nucleic acid-binding protein